VSLVGRCEEDSKIRRKLTVHAKALTISLTLLFSGSYVEDFLRFAISSRTIQASSFQ